LSCDPHDADSIAAQLRWFLVHPVEIREMGARGRQRILEQWNYEAQFDLVLRILQIDT
jgi:spore maturation protein CgeB